MYERRWMRFGRVVTPTFRHGAQMFLALSIAMIMPLFPLHGQSRGAQPEQIRYDEATRTFRIDAADVSYIFGVNQNEQLQTLYWGKRLRPGDPVSAARADGGTS